MDPLLPPLPLLIDAEPCPPVTAVLRATLPAEPGGCRADPAWAAAMGSRIHHRILASLAPGALPAPAINVPLPPDADALCDRAVSLWAGLGLEIGHPRAVEVAHANASLGYAGAPDLVAPLDGIPTLVELKVAACAERFADRLQVGAYYGLLDPKPARALIVALDPYAPVPRASCAWLDVHALRGCFQAFLDCVRRYHREAAPVFDPATGAWRA